MKFALVPFFVLSLVLFLVATPKQAFAQDISVSNLPAKSLTQGTWDFGLLAGGGTGLGYAKNTRFAYAGGRIGLILTKEHGTGWRQGNFEWAMEMLPAYPVITPKRVVYGRSIVPAVWRWNFTRGTKIAPYVSIAGGILFSTRNLPPGNTSLVNFTPQAAFGANIFLKQRRALLVEGAYVHHSNAGLGTDNPGYNAALFHGGLYLVQG